MPTTVVSVRGRTRAELEADPLFVYVGRAVRRTDWAASPFGNPFHPSRCPGGDAATPFREALEAALRGECQSRHFEEMARRLPELRGKRLGCWCGSWEPGQPDIGCHAVVLARLADAL